MKRRVNKSNQSLVVLLVLCALLAVTLVGCNEPVADDPVTPTSEVESEEVSEEVSDETSEEISEEAAEETYSAQEVMTLIDNLTVKYQYNDPEHIKALVIAANLDYITAEDLDTLLTTYGYTMDELATLYDECARDNALSLGDTKKYYSGTVDSITPEQEYDNRIALADVMLNENDKQFAVSFDENSLLVAHIDSEANTALGNIIDTEYSTSGELTVVNFSHTCFYGDIMEDPYASYQNN